MIVFLDTETSGLDPDVHEVIEVAWSVGDGPISTLIFPHDISKASPEALEVNGYYDRGLDKAQIASQDEMLDFYNDLKDATLCGANPAFDAAFLKRALGLAPWRYRLLDIEAYASGALGWEGDPVTGLRSLADYLRDTGHTIAEPDHTAAGDVRTLMDCYNAIRSIQVRVRASAL